jgi:RNAse (barnase) inhibitor barstar
MDTHSKQLANADRSGVYQLAAPLDDLARAVGHAALELFRIDLAAANDKKDLLARIAKALSFPEWFGGNWDALHDCLTDLDWLSAKNGYVLVIENSRHLAARRPDDFADFAAVLLSAAEHWQKHGRPFWVFIALCDGSDSGLPRWPADQPSVR